MRIEDVNPRQPRRALLLDPAARAGDHRFRTALGEREVRLRTLASAEIVVRVESLPEAELTIHGIGAHERARRESVLLRHLRERDRGVVEAEAGVVAHPVLEGVASGHDARVRRRRDHRMRMGEAEPDPVFRERIEVGRRGPSAVAAERIAAQRVDRDDQHVLIARVNEFGKPWRAMPPPPRQRRDGEHRNQHCSSSRPLAGL